MKYLKRFNLFKESVAINSRDSRHILDGDNFDLPKNLKFPEVEDLDMYLQLIEDDGYEYEVGEFIVKESSSKETPVPYTKFEFGVIDICDYQYIKVISVELPKFYDLNNIDFLEEFKRKYFKSDNYNMRIDVKDSFLKIKLINKKVIDVKNIIKKFNEDVEKFLNDNKDILTGDIDSFGFSTINFGNRVVVINNCDVSNLNLMKDKLEEFLNSYDYYIGVTYSQNRRMTFTLSMDLAGPEILM